MDGGEGGGDREGEDEEGEEGAMRVEERSGYGMVDFLVMNR